MNKALPHNNKKTDSTMAFARKLLSIYPRQSIILLIAFTIAGIMEGIGVTSMLPLLTMMTTPEGGSGTIHEATSAFFNLFNLTPSVGSILALIVILIMAKAAVSFMAMRKVNQITVNIAKDMRLRLIRALLRAQWRFFKDLAIGKSGNAIGTEASRASMSFLNLGKVLSDTIQVIIYIILAILISWKITLGAVLAGTAIMYSLRVLIKYGRQAGQQRTYLLSSILARISDTLTGVKPLKAMGRESFYEKTLEKEVTQLARAQQKEFIATHLLTTVREPALALMLAIGMYIAIVFMNVSLSTLLVLAFMFFRVVTKLTAIQSGYQRIAVDESAYYSLIHATKDAEKMAETGLEKGQPPPPLNKSLTLEHVSFSHKETDHIGKEGNITTVLEDISLTFSAYNFSAVIGPSGAGKTTLIDLLIGLYHPDEGHILIDGTPLEKINMREWRHLIGYLPQECILFHDTIFNNIALGEQDVTESDVITALKQAGAWSFIESLPDGMQTIVGERGSRFSGGQRQRIAIARALAHKPALLLLDEPTSAMDEETERQILQTVKELSKNITVIAITHNPAVIGYADHVFQIEAGKIIA